MIVFIWLSCSLIVRVWNTGGRSEALTFEHPAGVLQLTFSPDGNQLVSLHEGSARFTPCDVCGPIEDVLALAGQRVTRDLTPEERARYLHEPG